MRRLPLTLIVLSGVLLLAGCDQLGIESAEVQAEKRSAEGKAIGGACRHAARAIEDCYTLNKKGDRAAIYAGWREMEDYMRKHLTEPMGFGTWGYVMYRPKLKSGIDANGRMFHTPGGGSIAVRSTDMLRFGYLMLHEGRWGKEQILAGRPSHTYYDH